MSVWMVCAVAGMCAPPAAGPPSAQAQCLVEAYPEHVCGARAGGIVWCDGEVTPWGDGRPGWSAEQVMADPDLRSMMATPYRTGGELPPRPDEDPGRVRLDPFFAKMYGATEGAAREHTVRVRWMPRSGGKTLRVTSVNGVDAALGRVSARLEAAPRALREVAAQTSGGFVWRAIKGTSRRSAHSWGIAVDVAVPHAHYWKWSRPDSAGRYPYKNTMPPEIVSAFEAEGFIWGGRWYHYDTMHFEYRPELLCVAPHG